MTEDSTTYNTYYIVITNRAQTKAAYTLIIRGFWYEYAVNYSCGILRLLETQNGEYYSTQEVNFILLSLEIYWPFQ